MAHARRSKGFFITFEGPEGSGKSSQTKRLVRTLRVAGRRVLFVHDPGSTALGRRLRHVLLHEQDGLGPMHEAVLFFAGRHELIQKRISPALRKGQIVVCDRYHDSTVAYQGYGGGIPPRWLDRIGRRMIGDLMPDVTVLLDVPPATGLSRLRGAKDRMERKALEFHQRVHRGYRELARREPRRFVVLDSRQTTEQLERKIHALVFSRLKKRRRA